MAQYYIQMDDLKQIYPEVQVVHVDDNAVSKHNRPQQLVLQDDQILYNEGQVVYQQPSANNAQYQQQSATRYILSDDVNQQQQQTTHQQIMIHQQQQQTQPHYQQEQQQSQEQVQPELQMQHTQQQQNQQSPPQQLYYNSDQILQQNSIVHHSPHSQQQQSITQQLHVPQQQSQQQQVHQQYQQQQQIVHHQQSLQQNSAHQQVQPQTQQVVYRMPAQQQQLPQQTQMLNNTHVIVQPLIQSPHNQDIILRHPMPQQRIIYNTNRVIYSSPTQAQSQTILQQSNQQPHLQLQANPLQSQTRLVQTRVTTQVQQQPAQPQQQQQMQSGVIYQQMQPLSSNQIQKPPMPQPQQQLQLQQTTQMVATVRGAIRGKSLRGAGSPSISTRITGISTRGGIRATAPTQVAVSPTTKSPRSRNTGSGTSRGRGAGRGRGGRNNALVSNTVAGTTMQIQSPQVIQNKITIANVNQNQMKQIYRQQIVDSSGVAHPHLQLISTQRLSSIGTPRYRCPTDVGQTQIQASTSPNGGSSGELDLEDSIQAVIVKKDQQKVIPSGMNTTLTSYFKEDDDNRVVRSQNGQSISLTEFKKRNLSVNATGSIGTTKTIMTVRPQLNTGTNKISLTGSGQIMPLVPIARVTPQRMPQPEPETPIVTGSSVHQTAHNNYEIQTQHVLQNRSSHQMGEKDRNSAKMLVILVSGEQRLITFTLPRESCTVQDLLEQVGVSFDNNTTIQCVENPGANIDFVVTVGFSVQESASELISRAEQSLQLSRQQEAVAMANASNNSCATTNNTMTPTTTFHSSLARAVAAAAIADDSTTTKETTNVPSPSGCIKTSSEEVPRKIIHGFFAICQSCGFSGIDHAKCERCKRVFLEPPKRVPVKSSSNNNDSVHIKVPNEVTEKKRGSDSSSRGKSYLAFSNSTRGRGGQRGRSTRSSRKAVDAEPVILTLSSDDEAEDEPSNTSNRTSVSSLNSSKMLTYFQPLSFEPIIPENDESSAYNDFKRTDVTDMSDELDKSCVKLYCKNVRIGCFSFENAEPVIITSKGIQITAPLADNDKDYSILNIHKHEIVKSIGHFSKSDDIFLLCFYTLRKCAQYIKTTLNIAEEPVADGTTYFLATGPYQYRKIILHIESVSDQAVSILKSICVSLDEISSADAQALLERAAESDRHIIAAKSNEDSKPQLYSNDIRTLLIYPSGKGGISINTEDYMCLATDQYLNDIIIDFYLKWVHNNIIPKEEREKTYVFSTFFYKRLTTLVRSQQQTDKDVKQTAAQKRHARVQNWTKNVNLFDKDFIIIPINEQSHWFLAIICFPKLKGPVTYDTNIPVEPQQIKKQRGKKIALQIGNTTITPLSKRDSNPNLLADIVGVGDDHDSDRDEAEGDDEDLASDDSDFDSGENNTSSANTTQSPPNTSANITEKQPIKQPLILIFDSLAGAGRSRVVATLRDYLSCEYKLKMVNATPHVFNKENMPGHCVKVPQQNNFTDCGLFLLQYVEQFFKDPITDYRLPIKLSNWFDTLTVTRKREDISNLLQQLLNEKYGVGHQIVLPEISFPTLNGELVESHDEYNIEFEEDGMDDETAEEEEELTSGADGDLDVGSDELSQSPIKPTTTAVVPTHGRQIVVKRRMQIVSTNNELTPPHSTTMRNNLVKIRKLE